MKQFNQRIIGVELECELPVHECGGADTQRGDVEYFWCDHCCTYVEHLGDTNGCSHDDVYIDQVVGVEMDVAYDGSLDNGVEVRIKSPYHSLRRALSTACSGLLNYGGEITHTCGVHVHLNYEHKSVYTLRAVCQAFQKHERMFFRVVPATRHTNTYCHSTDVAEFHSIDKRSRTGHDSRYCWVNTHSLQTHGSLELRLHPGSLNAHKVMYWVDLLLAFEAKASKGKLPEPVYFGSMLPWLEGLGLPPEAQDYWLERERLFNNDTERSY